MDTARFHVVLLSEYQLEKDLIALSGSLDKNDNLVVLSSSKIPHITVYAPEIPSKNLDRAYTALEEIAHEYESFGLDFDSFSKPPRGDNGIFVNYKKEGIVEVLYNEVVEEINLLREEVVRAKYKNDPDSSGEIKCYGYPLSYYHFPHVTLARFQNQIARDEALEKLETHVQDNFIVRSIAVVETGEHGTAKKIIAEFPLK